MAAENLNRTDLIVLAESRVADAEVLLNAERWAAAYYLLGYAVECGLKACVARRFRQDEVPDRKLVNDFYTHNLDRLLEISGLKSTLDERYRDVPELQVSWSVVHSWSESSRYAHATEANKAKDMFEAVSNPQTGVMTWLRTQW